MKKVYLIATLILASFTTLQAQENESAINLHIITQTGVDLSDGQGGVNKSRKMNALNSLGAGFEVSKKWYGATFLYRLAANSYYEVVPCCVNANLEIIRDTLIPVSTSNHFYTGKLLITPLSNKYFNIQLAIGVSYAVTDQLRKFFDILQQRTYHRFLEGSGFGMGWDIKAGFNITDKITFTTALGSDSFTHKSKVGTFYFLDFGFRFKVY